MTKIELIEALELTEVDDDTKVTFMGYEILNVETLQCDGSDTIDLNDINQ